MQVPFWADGKMEEIVREPLLRRWWQMQQPAKGHVEAVLRNTAERWGRTRPVRKAGLRDCSGGELAVRCRCVRPSVNPSSPGLRWRQAEEASQVCSAAWLVRPGYHVLSPALQLWAGDLSLAWVLSCFKWVVRVSAVSKSPSYSKNLVSMVRYNHTSQMSRVIKNSLVVE